MPRFEYYVMGALTIEGVAVEIAKRAAVGWRVVGLSAEQKGSKRTIIVFERPVDQAAA